MPKGMLLFFLLLFAIAVGLVFVVNNQILKQSKSPNPTPTIGDLTFNNQNQQAQQNQPNTTQPITPQPTFGPYTQATYTAVLKTSKGDITLQLWHDIAPLTVENFLNKAQSGYYNNLIFWRVEDWVIQGGDPLGNGTGGKNMPVEFNNKPFVTGSLGQASHGDGKTQNDSQFFILKQDASQLNGAYTNYGMVTNGMDVVNQIKIGDKILSITVAPAE